MKKILILLLTAAAGAVFLFSAFRLLQYFHGTHAAMAAAAQLKQAALVTENAGETAEAVAAADHAAQTHAPRTTEDTADNAISLSPFKLDFQMLQQSCPAIIGWLYCEDTPIDYPIVSSRDNRDYLRRLPDGTYSCSGSLFTDCENSRDFTDPVTVIYGHNMQDDSMLGTLPNYLSQEYYDAHPQLWLLTPDRTFEVQVLAGIRTSAGSELYDLPRTEQAVCDYIANLTARSVFQSSYPTQYAAGDHYLLLSTCDYSFSGARFVLLCRLAGHRA